jgi:acyl-CoA synthetase (AMP-forming)/AMP-acid ligase II/thioesterase domain-containing protein
VTTTTPRLGRLPARGPAPLSAAHAEAGVIPRLREVVTATPDGVAVVDASGPVTFARLAAHAAAVLVAVRDAVGHGTEPVAVLHGHDAGAVAAIVGIVASGHPVVVLDPRTPVPRLRRFAEGVGARWCVSDAANEAAAGAVVGRVVRPHLRLPASFGVGVDPSVLWAAPPPPDAPAALAFTSGSTGVPKVVVVDHRTVVRDAWLNSVATGCYGAGDVVAHTLPMAFFAGLMATFAGPLAGATTALYDVRGNGIGTLPAWLEASGAGVLQASPAILRALVGIDPAPRSFAALRSLTVAGETAHGRDVEAARRLLPPGCTVRNRYGSSETGLVAEYAVAPGHERLEGALPVGLAAGDTVVTLVRDDGTPAPAGEVGIVTVTGHHLAAGYLGDPQATAAAFTGNPDGTRTYRTRDVGRLDEQGRLHLLGRRDHSVKIRGYLVEPGEVDAALFDVPGVAEAVTVGVPRPADGVMRLVAYVVPAVVPSGGRLEAADIRAALHATLPGYMVPETIAFLDALPRTERGKLDRAALPEPPAASAPTAGSRELTDWEQLVADVWADVLGLDAVGPDDDFFALGGDSLAAERLRSRVVADLGVDASDVTSSLLVQAPTPASFAARLRRRPDRGDGTLVPLQPDGTRPPLFVVAGGGGLGLALMAFARHLGPDRPTWALQAHALESRGLPDFSVAAAARRHLRALRRVQPDGPYHLAGHSFGGLVALEMAHQLRQAGEEVALLVMLDSFPPEPDLHTGLCRRSPVRWLRDTAGLVVSTLRARPGDDRYWRLYRQSMYLHRRYRTRPWPGETLVVVADSPEQEQRSRWAPHLSGGWELVRVPGDHLTMLRQPHVATTARAVLTALDRVSVPVDQPPCHDPVRDHRAGPDGLV